MAKVIDNPPAETPRWSHGSGFDLRQRVSADRYLAVVLIGIQLFLLADLSGARVFPIIMACFALWGLITQVRLRVEPMALNLINAMLLIGFLLHYMASPFPLPPDSRFIQSSLAHALARLLITIQVMQLYLFHEQERLPYWMGGCGAVALAFACDISVPEFAHHRLLGIMALFIAAFALYSSRSRRPVGASTGSGRLRGLLMSLALVAVLGLGTASSWAMQRHERNIEWFLSEHLGYGRRASRAGFTPSGQLQSVTQWKTDGGDRVMLRIFADSAPGYLRGKAFDNYQGSSRNTSSTSWASTVPRESLPEIDINRDLPKVRRQDRIYDLKASQPANPRVLDVWPEERTMAQIFTPLGATRIAINGSDVKRDSHGIVTINDREEALPYLVFASQADSWPPTDPAAPLSAEEHHLLTSYRDHIDDEVKVLARQLFADCRTTRQKLDAVRRHFLENYTYKLGINVPHRMDPVTYFLTKRPPAHCEYFATGTAVLLRLADVPCRYVVGYVCQEWNQVGGFWVARNKDAHAWVEAFDEEVGEWVIVESTPSAGVPQPREPAVASQISGTLRHRISILRMRIQEYGITSTLLSLVQIIWSIPGLLVLLGFFAALLGRYCPRGISLRRRDRPPSHLKGMHAALALLERRTRERGFVRPPEQTLTQFANGLRQSPADPAWTSAVADCYALYVTLRYQGDTGPEAVEEFRRAVMTVPTREPRSESRCSRWGGT